MPLESLIALTGLLAAATGTPGPNNAMLAASGATFGFARTLPHMLGVGLGFAAMIFLVAIGLGQVFEMVPALYGVIRILGIVLLIWVAWRIATARPPGTPGARSRPFTFLQAGAFQWVNPKAWALCLSVAAQFVSGANLVAEAAIVAAVSATVGLASAGSWAGLGAVLQRVLRRPAALRAFNVAMAAFILLGVAWLAADGPA